MEDWLQIVVGEKQVLVRSSAVKEVVRPATLTAVPMGPEHLIGLANLHGQIICMIDVGGVTVLPACNREATARTRFVVLRHPLMHVGIWADAVSGIRKFDRKVLRHAASEDHAVVQVDRDDGSYYLLDCDKLFN